MKSKKGFTLVELLAVIAILAILVLIAIPNVLNLYRNARKNTFKSDVQSILRASEQAYVMNSMNNGNRTCFDSVSNPLDIDARENLVYVVRLSNKGKITSIEVADNNYQILVDDSNGISKDEIGKTYEIENVNPKSVIVGCDSTALKQESEDKKLVIKKDNEEIRTIQMGRNTTTTIDKENDVSLITCNNGVEVIEENGQLKISNVLNNSVCTFSNDLVNTINNLEDTQKSILLINDLNLDKQIAITKPLTIEMNGKSINSSFNGAVISNNSNLTIKNSSENESSVTSSNVIIHNYENCTLNLDNVRLICSETENSYSTIYNQGKLIIRNSHIEGPYGIGNNVPQTATFDIYDSEIVGNIIAGINLNSGSASSGNIYNSKITGKQHAIWSASTGTINIYSGIFIGETDRAISNFSTGTINLTQKDTPIYVSSQATSWYPAIKNENTGTINIKGTIANKCTSNSSDTTSGVCIYGGNDNNGGVQNTNLGTININGATIYGGYQGINNNSTGQINISNANISSNQWAILNNREGTINICSGEIRGSTYDLNNSSTGIINYTSKVTLKNNTKNGTNVNLTDSITCK